MLLLLFFAFLAGLVTILTPCIWPLLPIILSSTISSKGHHRPLGITIGIMFSFLIFTLLISTLVRILHFDPNILRLFAVIVLVILGLTLVIPVFSKALEGLISRITGYIGPVNSTATGFSGGFITGIALGLVWSPCAGPILASIAALAATGKVTLDVFLVTLFYILGTGIPLFLFAYGGQKIFYNAKFINKYTGKIQRVFGILMLLTALAIYTNYDIYLQTKLLNVFPQLSATLNKFEQNSDITNQLNVLKGKNQTTPQISAEDQNGLFNTNSPSPDFVGGTKWLNSEKTFTVASLKGKVVLVDFWTYTCINCIRTLPFITSWYDKYKDKGFVVIGVHTPEFEFEHNTSNVENAIKMYNIHYPVVQDNNYSIWNNFNNQYWPAEYLIDANGNVRRTHFGEGEYDQTEKAIQALLKEAGQNVSSNLTNMPDQTPQVQLSPETYLGSSRMQYYYPDGNTGVVSKTFALSENLAQNSFSLGGQWSITSEDAVSGINARLNYNFFANKVFLVLNPGTNTNAKVKVYLDGKLVDSTNQGADVKNGEVIINTDRLYNLINLKNSNSYHILELEFETPGIKAFAFTFG